MVETTADARPARRHEDEGHVPFAGAGPALIAGHLEQIDHVEAVIAELDFADRPAAGVSDPHGGADDAPFIKRRVPRSFEPLRRRENAAERWTDVFAKDIGDAQMRLAVMKRQADCLYDCCHRK